MNLPQVSPFAGLDLATWLEQRARDRGAPPLLVWAPFEGAGRRWSYREFADDVARVAGGLAARGVRAGDRVLVQLENCPETLMVLFACARLGAIHVPINAMAAGPELAWYAQFTGADLGVWLVRITPEGIFYRITYVLVFLLGLELTRQGVTELFFG